MTRELVEGWTERIKDQLINDAGPFDLSGYLVGLKLTDRFGHEIEFNGSVGVEDAANGLVYFDPEPLDLINAKSPYYVRWQVTVDDADRARGYFPVGKPDVWHVRRK